MKRKITQTLITVLFVAAVVGGAFLLKPEMNSAKEKIVETVHINETPDAEITLPIIMYHSVLPDQKSAGKYVVTPELLSQDMTYLKEHGYTTVTIADLIAYVDHGTALPEKPVMLTFDDGYLNNKTYVLPLLEEHRMKAVISVVGQYTDCYSETSDPNPNYAYLTWADIRDMKESGWVEFQNHSYDLHHNDKRKGAMRMKGESLEAFQKCFCEDLTKMQERLKNNSGVDASAFTYPYGMLSKESKEYLKNMGFRASMTCYEIRNPITADPDCLFGLGRFNRPSGESTEAFMKRALG